MSYWKIDAALCRRDGVCVAECPLRLLELKRESLVPEPVPDAETRCIACGHCVAVCPHQALALEGMNPADCPPVKPDQALDSAAVEQFLRSRRSIRLFQAKPVERAKLEKLTDLAHYAPTGGNSQLIRYLVIDSRTRVREIANQVVELMRQQTERNRAFSEKYNWPRIVSAWDAGIDGITREAPALVMAVAPKTYGLAAVDAASALAYLDLAAPSLGLGACWAGFVMLAIGQWPPLQKLLDLPEGLTVYGAMMVGYPKPKYYRLPLRKPAEVIWKS